LSQLSTVAAGVGFTLNKILDDPFPDDLDMHVAERSDYVARRITPYRVGDRQEPTSLSFAPRTADRARSHLQLPGAATVEFSGGGGS